MDFDDINVFLNVVSIILSGKDKLDNFKKDQMEDYLDLMRDFEVKKRATDLTTDRKVTLRLAIELLEVLEANNRQIMTQFMQTFKHASKVRHLYELL